MASAVITIGGIITTIVMDSRTALKAGANAMGKLSKAIVNLSKKVAPTLGTLIGIIGAALSFGAWGIAFLSNNLWILAITRGYFLYNGIKKKYKKN